jgi:hypothetical protein
MLGGWDLFEPVGVFLQDAAVFIEDVFDPVQALDFSDGAFFEVELVDGELAQIGRQFFNGIVADIQFGESGALGQVGEGFQCVFGDVQAFQLLHVDKDLPRDCLNLVEL